MNLQLLSQHDPRWANINLGTSNGFIKDYGCTLTAVSIRFGVTPDFLNKRLNEVNGFAPSNPNDPYNPEKNLIIWKKLEEALPGVQFVYKYSTYDNEKVKNILPCVVQVDAAPIGGRSHWVLYIGNQQLIDPFDGKVKPTSTYRPISFVELSGSYKALPQAPVVTQGNYYKGLDMNNTVSVRTAIDTWYDVVNGKYVPKDTYDQAVKSNSFNEEAIKNYGGFVALGYNTVDDVMKVIQKANDKILKLLQDTSILEKKNYALATTIADESKSSFTAIDEAMSTLNENKELKEGVAQIAQVAQAEKPSVREIITRVLTLQDITKRLQDQKQSLEPVVEEPKKEVKPFTTNRLFELLNLVPTGKGVK